MRVNTTKQLTSDRTGDDTLAHSASAATSFQKRAEPSPQRESSDREKRLDKPLECHAANLLAGRFILCLVLLDSVPIVVRKSKAKECLNRTKLREEGDRLWILLCHSCSNHCQHFCIIGWTG